MIDELRKDFIDMTKIDSSKSWDKYWKASQHNSMLKKINTGIYLKGFAKFLIMNDYTHISVNYEGSGDSGDAYYAEGYKHDEFKSVEKADLYNTTTDIWSKKNLHKGTKHQKEIVELFDTWLKNNPEVELGIDKDLHWILADMITYDWYNNEGGSGNVLWTLCDNTVEINGYQNYYGQTEAWEKFKLDGSDPFKEYKDIG